MKSVNKIVLFILDGFATGNPRNEYNAFAKTDLPFLKPFIDKYKLAELQAAGVGIGLPEGQIGSSEVGHLTIGAGRVIKQPIQEINDNISSNNVIKNLIKSSSVLNIIGLVSTGGVHSSVEHLKYILRQAVDKNPSKKIKLHIITDGRDTQINESIDVLRDIKSLIIGTNIEIATISGRFFAMDRDSRWERVEKFYNVLMAKNTPVINDVIGYIENSHRQNLFDEFIEPAILEGFNGIKEEDEFLFFNFRADRMRQVVRVLCEQDFHPFECNFKINQKSVYTFTDFFSKSKVFENINVVFEKKRIKNHLCEIYAQYNLSQLKIAETEKYAHVTFFFNAEKDTPFENEDKILIPSPKIRSYDLQPEMSLKEMEGRLIEAINTSKYELIVCNIANCDMVGHTGNFVATQKALVAVDEFLANVYIHLKDKNYTVVLTADHGNIDDMYDVVHKQPNTKHSLAPVPFCVDIENLKLANNISIPSLANVAPTILKLAGLEKPEEMVDSLI